MLKEEHRLRVFDNRVLRKIFGPKRDEVIGDWRKLHDCQEHTVSETGSVTVRRNSVTPCKK
jgi:hypothetical protein